MSLANGRLTVSSPAVTRYTALRNAQPPMLPRSPEAQAEWVTQAWESFEAFLAKLPYPTELERDIARTTWWYALNLGALQGYRKGLKEVSA